MPIDPKNPPDVELPTNAPCLSPLTRHPRISKPSVLLVIVLDGWGESKYTDQFNAIHHAPSPTMDALKQTAAQGHWRLVKAHGTAVGLPSDDDMGNSEVGHNALGAGQIVDQGAALVDKSVSNGSVFELPGWLHIEQNATDKTLHLIGLLSDGGVHSRYDQLILLLQGCITKGVKKIRLHVLSDGRDVEDGTACQWVEKLLKDVDKLNNEGRDRGVDVKIASGGGRMLVTMDRYQSDWNVVKRGWEAHIHGIAPNHFTRSSLLQGIKDLQSKNGFTSDQFIEPWVVVEEEGSDDTPVGPVDDGDAVVTFNFRADRMIELSMALEYSESAADLMKQWSNEKFFDRGRVPKDLKFAGMMQYDGELKLPSNFLVPPPLIERGSEEYLVQPGKEDRGVTVFACSESQKIGHVTFFWNGNRSGYLDEKKEKFVEIPSDTGISFDQKPAMKARETTDTVKDALKSGNYDFVRLNFANPDMVGHTGNLEATKTACHLVDSCVKELLDIVNEMEGARFLITADHGNAEDMVQRDKKTGQPLKAKDGTTPIPLTSHTLNPVPVAIGGNKGLPTNVRFVEEQEMVKRNGGKPPGLTNVTATFIELLGYEAPDFYEKSLIEVVDE